ncbi:MAG TPA: hypothetical protein VFD62_15400 [Pyrinomonadaceae bacterium]|nr:hypothetical protein [Pyrinomonadaceae bacterium]
MPKDNENIRLPFTGPIEPSEPQGFTPDQMIRCDECLRANPPTRVACLYCSAPLPMTEESARLRKPVLKPPEKHQTAYNNILLPSEREVPDEDLAQGADLLKLSAENLKRIMAAKIPLPVACTASREEAELVFKRLRDVGLQTIVLSDDELGASETSVKRIKSMTVDDEYGTLQQAGTREQIEVRWREIVLIVTGRLFTKRVEIQERKARRSENEIVQSSEFSNDEAVIDFYTSTHPQTWRINANGFDFSCLGNQKTLIANENISRLRQFIASNAPQAKVDDCYKRLRQTLDLVWASQQETQSSGWRRERPGKLSVGLSTVNSNEIQFTRYSRLQRYFHLNA